MREQSAGGKGFWIAVDCTGQPGVWSDAIELVRPGGLVNLFGGCAPGTSIPLDTHLVHYSELTLKGVYHHRPDTFRRAIALLADPAFKADLLHLRHAADRRRRRRASKHDAQGSAEGRDPERSPLAAERRRGERAQVARRFAPSSRSTRNGAILPRMKMRILLPVLLAVALTTAALISFAWNADGATPGIVVTKAWARATPPGATTGAVYLTIENQGRRCRPLVKITSPAAGSAMLHETIEEGGVSQMRDDERRYRAGHNARDEARRRAHHADGLTEPLKEGETISVTLDFEKAEDVTVEAKIAPIGADGPVE